MCTVETWLLNFQRKTSILSITRIRFIHLIFGKNFTSICTCSENLVSLSEDD